MSSKLNFDRGRTSNASIHHNKCDAGSSNTCPNWAPRPHPPNLVETRKAAKKGSSFARQRVFLLFAKRLKCLNLFQPDEPSCHFFFISSSFFSFYRTSSDVLVLPLSLNVNFHLTPFTQSTIGNTKISGYLRFALPTCFKNSLLRPSKSGSRS